MMRRVLDQDPAGGVLALSAMLRGTIAMPGQGMHDGGEPGLFDRFAIVAQRANVYTARDYAAIVAHLVKTWDIAGLAVTGPAARAQNDLCRLAGRLERLADRMVATLARQPQMPFSWIHERTA